MKWGLSLRDLPFVVVAVAAGPFGRAVADPAQNVTVTPETPTVEVSPRRAGRQLVDLPALEYSFDVEARCEGDWVPESLSLNIADSRITFDAGDLLERGQRKVLLNVPARQLAPIAINDFCLLEEASATAGEEPSAAKYAARSITVEAVLSAHASLLCSSEQERRITYVSLPLDVTLSCKIPDEAGS